MATAAVGTGAVAAVRRRRGVRGHGVLAGVAGRREHVLTDLVPSDGQVLLVEPRRMRDRAGDIVAEEADLEASLARTWDVTDVDALPTPARRLRPAPGAHRRAQLVARAGAGLTRLAAVAALGWPPAVGEGEALLRQLRQVVDDGYRVVVCRGLRGIGGPHRQAARRARPRVRSRRSAVTPADGSPRARRNGRGRAARPGCDPAGHQAGPAGRGRPDRAPAHPPASPPGPPRRPAVLRGPEGRRLRGPPPPRRGAVRRHGEAGHRRRGARLPAARVPRRRPAVRPVGPDRRGPAVLRWRDADPEPDGRGRLRPRQGQGRGPPSPRSPRSSSSSTRSACTPRATRSRPTRRGSARSRRRSRSRRRPISSSPSRP